VIDRHNDFIANVAFSQTFQSFENQWKAARQAARDVLFQVLGDDVSHIVNCILQIAKAMGSSDPLEKSAVAEFERLMQLRPQLWTVISNKLIPSDHDALRNLLSPMARLAAFSDLNLSVYGSGRSAKQVSLLPSIRAVNVYLNDSRKAFISFSTKSSELSLATSLRRFLQEPGVVGDICSLILAPDDGLQQAALAIITQGYDVEVREECLRCLFENYPEQALGGVTSCIKAFNSQVSEFREASKFAQALVLVLNDVCEVLCSETTGLLLDETFRPKMIGDGREATIVDLWKLMTLAISKLFRTIPSWSRILPEKKQDLITLIRDSLIFGRELIDHRKILQTVVELGDGQETLLAIFSPRNLSNRAIRMMDNLQPMLIESLRLLRLTDMELLHQSCKLIEALFDSFRGCKIQPNPEAVEKLKQILEQARATQATKKNIDIQSRLNESQISLLTLKLKELEPEVEYDEDEITFLGITKSSNAAKTVEPTPAAPNLPTSCTKQLLAHPSGPTKSSPVLVPRASKPGMVGIQLPPRLQTVRESVSLPPKPQVVVHPKPNKAANTHPISSSSESESESEKGIAVLDKHQKSPVKIKERRGIKLLNGPVKQNNTIRSRLTLQEEAQRRAMRLRPDVSGLYKMILQWNYDHTGSDPPDIEKLRPHLQAVPRSFKSPEEYFHTFEPLLRIECWSQLMKSKDEPLEEVRCQINGKGFVDQFLEMQLSIQQLPDPGWFLADTDIVLFRRASGGQGHLAKVQEMKRARTITVVLRFHNSSVLQKEAFSLKEDYILSRVFR
jgi:senataxin